MVPASLFLDSYQRFPLTGSNNCRVVRFPCKDFADAVSEMRQGQRVVVGVKAGLIPAGAKINAVVEIGVPGVGLSLFRVRADVFPVIDHLEVAVLFNHPCDLFAHERFQDGGRVFVVVVRRIDVADVVQKCA